MLKLQCEVKGLKDLKKYIKLVEKLAKLEKSNKFQKFIQKKALETVKRVTDERLTGGTTNDATIDLYKSSHKIEKTDNGFILYNDAKIPANSYNRKSSNTDNYPKGEFSIALAFEYGTGVVGEGSYDGKYFTPWKYNVNNYEDG